LDASEEKKQEEIRAKLYELLEKAGETSDDLSEQAAGKLNEWLEKVEGLVNATRSRGFQNPRSGPAK
jgi:hypothetical protein